jgi:hypothetical protein
VRLGVVRAHACALPDVHSQARPAHLQHPAAVHECIMMCQTLVSLVAVVEVAGFGWEIGQLSAGQSGCTRRCPDRGARQN